MLSTILLNRYGQKKNNFDQVKINILTLREGVVNYSIDEETSSDTLALILPFSEQKKFPNLFAKLEGIPDIDVLNTHK